MAERSAVGAWARANNAAVVDKYRMSDGEIVALNDAVASFVRWDGSYGDLQRGFARAIVSFERSTGRTLTMIGVYLVLNDDSRARLKRKLGGCCPVVNDRLIRWARRRERREEIMERIAMAAKVRPRLARATPARSRSIARPSVARRSQARGGPQRRAVRVVRRRAHVPPGSSDPSGSSDDDLARRALIGGAV